ncbi:unnamed protein product [Sympodiomycopsis kandeliae]
MPPKPKLLTPSQRQVFALYRKGLRAIRHKPEESQPSFLLYLRHAFKSPSGGGGLSKRQFSAIEYMIRRGTKMVDEIFVEKGVKKINVPAGAVEWWEAHVQQSKDTSHKD